ncbi:actin-like protein 7A [Oxyura jamaicensis]|uniref:actin-like protein 7A n=1 Tax=Oxyura jamaicensis TaxID=8884 RepID=UPI0015A5D64E|nr:actin-like protein 7A [Oxyura jamaicensis]
MLLRSTSSPSCKQVTAAQEGPAAKAAPDKSHSKPIRNRHASQTKGYLEVVKRTEAVVIDMGTGYFKCGFAGEPWPSHIVSPAGNHVQETKGKQEETFIGKVLQNTCIPLKLISPLTHGIVVDWKSVQDILECIFQTEMQIQPEDHAVLMSVPPLCSTADNKKYVEMMFEGFHVPAVHLAYQSQLSMYSYGKTSGLVVESGHGASHAVPIYEGYVLRSITGSVDYAGLDITNYLMQLLHESGYTFTEYQLNIIEDLKERCCYTSLDLTQDLNLPLKKQQTDYELPDGHVITVGKERFLCAEALFKPSLFGSQQPGLSQLTLGCLKNCDDGIKKRLVRNVLLCGGSTMMEGFPDRFQSELSRMWPSDNVLIMASPQRKSSVWIGGSILASLYSFQKLWVYRREYEEEGPSCIFKKCF